MLLPTASPPRWFVLALHIAIGARVVIVDDDASIHELWRTRLAGLAEAGRQFEVVHYSSLAELRSHCERHGAAAHAATFLIDYEIHGAEGSGIDSIEQLGIASSSVLVTSHADDRAVRQRCAALSVRLLPKSAAPFVRIHIGKN